MKRRIRKSLAVLLAALLLTGAGALGAAAGEVKNISCSVYADGATGRGFCWLTDEQAGSDVQLVPAAGFNGDFANAKTYTGSASYYRSRYTHKVAVTDLAPGTEYVYRVGDAAANEWSETCRFVTDDRDGCFSFITIADVQASSDENFAHAAKTMAGAVATLPGAEFIVNLGDYVNDNTNDEWDWYFSNFAFANNATTGVPVAGAKSVPALSSCAGRRFSSSKGRGRRINHTSTARTVSRPPTSTIHQGKAPPVATGSVWRMKAFAEG